MRQQSFQAERPLLYVITTWLSGWLTIILLYLLGYLVEWLMDYYIIIPFRLLGWVADRLLYYYIIMPYRLLGWVADGWLLYYYIIIPFRLLGWVAAWWTIILLYLIGYDLVEWLMDRLAIEDGTEALHLATLFCYYGYFFPVTDSKNLSVKDDGTLYRFQVRNKWWARLDARKLKKKWFLPSRMWQILY